MLVQAKVLLIQHLWLNHLLRQWVSSRVVSLHKLSSLYSNHNKVVSLHKVSQHSAKFSSHSRVDSLLRVSSQHSVQRNNSKVVLLLNSKHNSLNRVVSLLKVSQLSSHKPLRSLRITLIALMTISRSR
jgi:hypothetical protein